MDVHPSTVNVTELKQTVAAETDPSKPGLIADASTIRWPGGENKIEADQLDRECRLARHRCRTALGGNEVAMTFKPGARKYADRGW
ncbi:hypothetical protein [Bradyrhizobium sp. SUTN9-2]|uniref:hypothetical protein n=1 Tax=Bradyrhizobium sp. SUTN9-2 TaxID=1167456 RepID=UPI001304C398|nr:hypothetical protein [Bradyrhizobium sp. SUTN9-2]MCA1530779.1 hypothetical protein [Bradyrhizobium yuanmingense]